jgi:zinc protease
VPTTCGAIAIVDRPGAVQSSIAIGWRSASASDPDRAALEVLSAATGGWLSSRLNLTVRKELGASYGVRSSLLSWRAGGTLELTTAVETDRTADALAGMLREIDRLRSEPLGADELASAKSKTVIGDERSSSRGLAYRLAHSLAEGLPVSDVAAHAVRVEALSAEDVRGAAEKWVGPAKRCIVIVGDAVKIAPAITSLGVGRIEVTRPRHR